jgi:hypothetical protein
MKFMFLSIHIIVNKLICFIQKPSFKQKHKMNIFAENF